MATIKEIAERVGYSLTTVSRVLNYDSSLSVSEATRRQIIETAEELNYTPPRLRGKRQQAPDITIVPVSLVHFLNPAEELADPYYITVRHSIEKRLLELGLKLNNQCVADDELPAAIAADGGALIVVGPHKPSFIDALAEQSIPCVFVDFPPTRKDVDCVYPDLTHAMTNLMDQLWERGFRSFGFIGSRSGGSNPKRPFPEYRHDTFLEWFRQHDLEEPSLVRLQDLSPVGGFEMARDLLSSGNLPQVLIAANDTMAIGAMHATSSLNLKVPEDIRIVGFNDIPAAALTEPSLTTVSIPADEIGRSAVDLLVERLAGRQFAKRLILTTNICWRESC
ncbi:LacI family DNA-binding transcriptional regulator [uncultured Cohaesibacter sp.]|uniref:LacI family DNA-binding transcriptional regulator n=1 Tax=uncultured Cohaesibacter sp. TaxID=1002546 RepID=UPI0029315587|nr:LacI family DNA-binding transcriptional regulator [uncultured Cohaesibacter sp.]